MRGLTTSRAGARTARRSASPTGPHTFATIRGSGIVPPLAMTVASSAAWSGVMSETVRPIDRSASSRAFVGGVWMRPAAPMRTSGPASKPQRCSSAVRASRPTRLPRVAKDVLQLMARAWSSPSSGPAFHEHQSGFPPYRSTPLQVMRPIAASASIPERYAAAAVRTFEMDAGSRRWVNAAAPSRAMVRGSLTAARIAPVRGSRSTIVPRQRPRASRASRASSRSRVSRSPPVRAASRALAVGSQNGGSSAVSGPARCRREGVSRNGGSSRGSSPSVRARRPSPSSHPTSAPRRSRTTVVAPTRRGSRASSRRRPTAREARGTGLSVARRRASSSSPRSRATAAA